MLLSDFIKTLAGVTGNGNLESLKTFVETNKTLEIPDDVASGISSNILTMESAKNNSQLHDHFLATNLNFVDGELDRYMTERKLDPKLIEEIKAEKKTAKRAVMLAEKLEKLKEEAISATGGDKKVLADKVATLETQIANLNNEIVKGKEGFETKLKEEKANFTNKLRDYQVDKHFAGYKYANDKTEPATNVIIAKTLMNEQLKKLELKTAFDEETGQVKLLTSKDAIYYKDNKPMDFQQFTDSLLADNHLLQVSDKPDNNGANGKQQNISISPANNGQGQINNSKFSSALKEAAVTVGQTN